MNKRIYVYQVTENGHNKLTTIRTTSQETADLSMRAWLGKYNFLFIASTFQDHISVKFMSNILAHRGNFIDTVKKTHVPYVEKNTKHIDLTGQWYLHQFHNYMVQVGIANQSFRNNN